ncbi:unnamed protein product [Rotaria socialis]|uniref:G domain-containing protein n=1 Tax=Rotaria socialis TaxID=392032 RepID=A0A821XQT0_9BILA|nr:unnamed protein product [Rotaria socialis]CAF3716216.1 unnamed protein product [Rotaria socialis]CAF4394854.1 unnamed protein product [Rotaria socialis]CAF4948424.1 unnamed protein product [Rotaria socialis]
MIQALIKQKLDSKQLLYEPCAIIIGKSGAGKTTLVKKLCNENHESNTGNSNKQQEYGRCHVDCYEHGFTIVDTPATDCSKEVYKHAVLLKESLTKEKLNTIFFIIKYDGRFEKMIENYFQLESLVSKYASKIVVIISYWDQSKDPENEFNEMCELFAEECPNMSNLIVYSEQSSGADVANLMYNCISNMDEEVLVITDEEFTLNFNLYEIERSINKLFDQYQKQVNLIVQKNIESIEEKSDLFRTIIDKFKVEIEELMEHYSEANVNGMHPLDRDKLLAKMKNENATIRKEFAVKVRALMSSNLFNDERSVAETKNMVASVNSSDMKKDDQQEINQNCNNKNTEQNDEEKNLESSNLPTVEQTNWRCPCSLFQ